MPKSKYNYNLKLFNINTEHKAYILGFIVADGTISKTKSNHSVTMYQKEKQILNDIQHITDGRVSHTNRDQYVLRLNSKYLFEQALTVGLRQNKSHNGIDTELMKSKIPSNLVKHFFRGLIDGDGCITLTPAPSYEFQPCVHLALTDKLLVEWFKSYFNLTQSISSRLPRDTNFKSNEVMYSITIRHGSVRILYDMYSDSLIHINRKKKRADMILSFFD